jgi:hypothetical protein
MISEKIKIASAVVSMASVMLAALGAASNVSDKPWLPNTLDAFYIALVGAMASSIAILITNRNIQKNRQPRSIFIAYSHKDRVIAKEICELLRSAGFDPWLDEEKLLPGQDRTQEIPRAIAESGGALILLSQNFQSSKSAVKDLDRVNSIILSRDKNVPPILPVRLDSSEVPPRLSGLQWVDWTDVNAKTKLLCGLSFITGQPANAPI